MKWSIKLGKIGGAEINLHWTFALLIIWIFFAQLAQTRNLGLALDAIFYILALFGCVLLHELGHALTARKFGIRTRDITLLPIGGVARLERIPEKPAQEFWVALAGPAVNMIIAALLFGFLLITQSQSALLDPASLSGNAAARLLWVNVFLALFNLLPAFPMDGGRILRALLAFRLGRHKATTIASNVGQFMAILFGILGFLFNPLLIFIAIFVYLGAQAEAHMVETVSLVQGLQAQDAMMTRFRTLTSSDTVATAARELLSGSQQDFPIVDGSQIRGLLRRKDLIRALAEGRRESPVSEFVSGDCLGVEANDPLEKILERMRADNCSMLPVLQTGEIVGLLTLENISELVMIRSAAVNETKVATRLG